MAGAGTYTNVEGFSGRRVSIVNRIPYCICGSRSRSPGELRRGQPRRADGETIGPLSVRSVWLPGFSTFCAARCAAWGGVMAYPGDAQPWVVEVLRRAHGHPGCGQQRPRGTLQCHARSLGMLGPIAAIGGVAGLAAGKVRSPLSSHEQRIRREATKYALRVRWTARDQSDASLGAN